MLRINEIINKVLQRFVDVIIKQTRFLFDRCIKENIQSSHFKKIFTIMLRKFEKKKLHKIVVIQINCVIKYVEQSVEIDCFKTHLLRRRDVENAFKHANERMLTTFNKYDFAIHHEKDSHDIK